MCIAIYQPAGKVCSKEELRNGWANNPDGAGLVWLENGEINLHKELNSFKRFWKKYIKITNRVKNTHMLIHFRIGTSGKMDLVNCHPHVVNDGLAFIHNGILRNIVVPKDSEISDTVIFNREIIQPLANENPEFLSNTSIQKLLSSFSEGNKILFMNNDGKVWIINSELGHWKDEKWYSNYSYCHAPAYHNGKKYAGFNTTSNERWDRKEGKWVKINTVVKSETIKDDKDEFWDNKYSNYSRGGGSYYYQKNYGLNNNLASENADSRAELDKKLKEAFEENDDSSSSYEMTERCDACGIELIFPNEEEYLLCYGCQHKFEKGELDDITETEDVVDESPYEQVYPTNQFPLNKDGE